MYLVLLRHCLAARSCMQLPATGFAGVAAATAPGAAAAAAAAAVAVTDYGAMAGARTARVAAQ